jgi:lysophospholipase L1-like esterase
MIIKNIIFSLIPALTLLLTAEILVRLFSDDIDIDMGYETLWMDVLYEEDNFIKKKYINGVDYFYTEMYPAQYYRGNAVKDKSLDGKYITVNKKSSTTRIFSYGGSSTAGSPHGHWASFTRFLSQQLNMLKKSNDTAIETINFGTSAGSIARAEFLLRKTIHLQPDVVIVYSGHNEICDSGAITYHTKRSSALNKINEIIYLRSYAYRYLTTVVQSLKPTPPFPKKTFAQHQCRRPQLSADFKGMDERFSKHVKNIIDLTKEYDVKVLFVTQVANEFLMPSDILPEDEGIAKPPPDKYWRTGRRVIVSDRSKKVLSSYIESDDNKTILLANELLKNDPNNPIAQYILGLVHLKKQNLVEAKKYLALAMDNDRQPTRTRSTYTKILKKYTEKHKNAFLIDTEKNITQLVPDRIYDGRIILDVMHPNVELHKYLSNEITKQYFMKYEFRADLFGYNKFNADYIYKIDNVDERYGFLCAKFYESKTWKECLDEALDDYNKPREVYDFYKKRGATRVWENAYYYGKNFKIKSLMDESRSIAEMQSNKKL